MLVKVSSASNMYVTVELIMDPKNFPKLAPRIYVKRQDLSHSFVNTSTREINWSAFYIWEDYKNVVNLLVNIQTILNNEAPVFQYGFTGPNKTATNNIDDRNNMKPNVNQMQPNVNQMQL